jgi:broad specificity phosphatase PhoE
MGTLILIRHSIVQPQPGVLSRLWPLTDEGRARCIPLADLIRPYRVERLYSSDEPKAFVTAEIIREQLAAAPVIVDAGLCETRRETVPYFENRQAFEAAIHDAMTFPDELRFGEETFSAARVRLTETLIRIVSTHPHGTVAAVTHATILTFFLAPIVGQDPFELWKSMDMPAVAVLSTPDYALKELRLSGIR